MCLQLIGVYHLDERMTIQRKIQQLLIPEAKKGLKKKMIKNSYGNKQRGLGYI